MNYPGSGPVRIAQLGRLVGDPLADQRLAKGQQGRAEEDADEVKDQYAAEYPDDD